MAKKQNNFAAFLIIFSMFCICGGGLGLSIACSGITGSAQPELKAKQVVKGKNIPIKPSRGYKVEYAWWTPANPPSTWLKVLLPRITTKTQINKWNQEILNSYEGDLFIVYYFHSTKGAENIVVSGGRNGKAITPLSDWSQHMPVDD